MPAPTGTTLTEIDVSDPGAMRLVKTLTVDGWLVGARLTGSTARVVVASQPTGIAWVYPETDAPDDIAAAEAANRALIRRSQLRNWVPTVPREELRDGRGVRAPAARALRRGAAPA